MIKTEIKVLSSAFRRTMPINECGEKLVDLRVECPGIAFDIAEYLNIDGKSQSEFEDAHFVRKTVAEKINLAQASLSGGLKLLIRCGYRTPEVQARGYNETYAELAAANPDWDEVKMSEEIEKQVDPPDVGPHCSGGAVDLSIVDKNGVELDMGTTLGVRGNFSTRMYTYSDEITESQRANRKILIDAMTGVEFFDFPAEWWHWSYGEREWAFANNQVAFYGPIEKRI